MRIRRLAVGLAAAATLGLAVACADDTTDPGETPSPPPPPVVEISGELAEGVEAGCVLLRTEQDDYLLIGELDDLPTGAPVTVRGHPDPEMLTTCQQGTPFVVDEVVSP